jgi:hypothetical protein
MNRRVYNALNKEARVGKGTMFLRRLGLLETPKGGLGFGNLLNNRKVLAQIPEAAELRPLLKTRKISTKQAYSSIDDLHRLLGDAKLNKSISHIDIVPSFSRSNYGNWGNGALRHSTLVNESKYLLPRDPVGVADDLIRKIPKILDTKRIRNILRDADKASDILSYNKFTGYLNPSDISALLSAEARGRGLRGLTNKQVNSWISHIKNSSKNIIDQYTLAIDSDRQISNIISKLKELYR